MSANAEQRRLAAIMFTDMVGYSAMAQRDDQLALALLEEHRQLLREIFPRFRGTEIKTIGDALVLAPQDPALLVEAGNLAQARGENTQGLDLFRRAVALDPVNAQAWAFLAGGLSVSGKQEEARAKYDRVIQLNPSAPFGHAGVGQSYLLQGKFEQAATAAQQDAADWARLLIVSCARWGQKRIPESDAALAELIAKIGETAAYQIAEAYAYRNDKDHAFEWLERARRQHDAGLPGLRADTLLPNLHGDPRWDAFLRTMGLADDQLK